jgi:hypothetical protein
MGSRKMTNHTATVMVGDIHFEINNFSITIDREKELDMNGNVHGNNHTNVKISGDEILVDDLTDESD